MVERALLIRAGFENELVDQFLSRSAAYVGWDRMGDLSGLSSADIDRMLLKEYPDSRTAAGVPNKHHREITELVLNVRLGDLVITPHRATRTFVVGKVIGPYRFDDGSDLRSKHEVYRHSIPVEWTHSVLRDELDQSVFGDTDQRGKTAFWLKQDTVRKILAAPAHLIQGRHAGSSSGPGGQSPSKRTPSPRPSAAPTSTMSSAQRNQRKSCGATPLPQPLVAARPQSASCCMAVP